MKNLMYWIDLILLIGLLIFVLFLQYQGYYNRIYLKVDNCGNVISIQKITGLEWEQAKHYIEEANKKPVINSIINYGDLNGTIF